MRKENKCRICANNFIGNEVCDCCFKMLENVRDEDDPLAQNQAKIYFNKLNYKL